MVYGGYSQTIVTDEAYTLHIPDNLDLAAVAPLLCAGTTVWSPFVHYGVRSHHAVGVVGLGGLGALLLGCVCVHVRLFWARSSDTQTHTTRTGHIAVKLLVAMGCDVHVISTSSKKEALAKELGAHHFVVISDEEAKKAHASKLDFIIDTG